MAKEKQKKVFIIDDEEEICAMLESFFEDKNLKVVTFPDGVTALKYIKEKAIPDLVIIDLLLPKEHGIDVMHKINNQYILPVIIISGIYHKDEIIQSMSNDNVKGFFEKPLDLNRLWGKVENILHG